MKNHIIPILALLLMGLWFQSCSNTNGPASSLDGRVSKGDVFTFENVRRDLSGTVTSRDTFDRVMLDVGLNYLGKSNVVKYSWDSYNTFYFAYETDGSISILVDTNSAEISSGVVKAGLWAKLPVNGSAPNSYTIADTMDGGIHYVITLTLTNIGTESILVGSRSYPLHKIQYEMTVVAGSESGYYDDGFMILEYSPELGFFGRVDFPSYTRPGRQPSSPSTQSLISYKSK